jgi:hypothetical protein
MRQTTIGIAALLLGACASVPPSAAIFYESREDGNEVWHLMNLTYASLKKARLEGSHAGMRIRVSETMHSGRVVADIAGWVLVRPGEFVSAEKLRLSSGANEDGSWCFILEANTGRREKLCGPPQSDIEGGDLPNPPSEPQVPDGRP